MDFAADLSRAWAGAFPGEPMPLSPEITASLSGEVSPAAIERLEALEHDLHSEIEDLEMKTKQKRFLCNFLDRLLYKLSRQELPEPPPSLDSPGSSVSSPKSSMSPVATLPRVGKASLISPVVPRGTLIRVKDALRQSGLLLENMKYEWTPSGDPEVEEDLEELEEMEEGSRGASVSTHRSDRRPTDTEGDDDSLDDYLYDALSGSEHDEPDLPGRELPPVTVKSKPFPPSPDESAEDSSDVYVKIDVIKRRKEANAAANRMSNISGVGASPQPTAANNNNNNKNSIVMSRHPLPTPPPKKTLHQRLSYTEFHRESFETDLYEELSNLSTALPAPLTPPVKSVTPALPATSPGDRPARRAKDPNVHSSPTADRHGMACASLAAAAVHHMATHEVVEAPEYEMLSSTSSIYSDQPIDVTGEDRSNTAVARRLALAKTNSNQPSIGRVSSGVSIIDHRRLLAKAEGDPRRQELIYIMKNEELHLQILEILAGCQRLFMAHNYPGPKIEVVFKFVTALRQQQESFVLEMSRRLHNWTPDSNTADVFSVMDDYRLVHDYIANLPTALKTYEELTSERRDIADVIDVFSVQGQKVKFIHLMQQPVVWLTKSSLNMKRIIELTSPDHPDYAPLQSLHSKLLEIIRSGSFGNEKPKERATSMIGGEAIDLRSRFVLVRHSLLVEMSVSGRRKLRQVFLFPEMLVCAKPRPPSSGGSSFEVRWTVQMATSVVYKIKDNQSEEMRSKRKAEIETLKTRIKQLRSEIKKEVEKEGPRSSIRKWRPYGRRGIDKLKEQLHKTQASLILASPNLEFRIGNSTDKPHTLLMSSEFERRSWCDAVTSQKQAAIQKAQESVAPPQHYSNSDVQVLLEEYKDMVSVNRLGSCLLHDGQDGCLSGVLKVKIHRVEGLKEAMDCVVCVEVDSFEHFDLCAKTLPVGGSTDLVIDQEFDIELDFSTTVRFIVSQMNASTTPELRNIAKLELRLDPDSLSSYREKPHGLATFDDPSHSILLTLSLSHQAAHQTLSRQPSDRRGALFGVPLDKVVRRQLRGAPVGTEAVQVPLIVRACTEELDRRALEEPGIYRISGMSADVQKLRDNFEKNTTATSRLLADYDVHVISGVLKAYLRELPEPLFTVERYRDFMTAFELSPIEAKKDEFIRLVNALPEPNMSTTRHLLRHFARINRKSELNKMVASNLGLIFGPTLLSPASSVLPCDILSVTMESFKQSGTLTFVIALTTDGHLFADTPKDG